MIKNITSKEYYNEYKEIIKGVKKELLLNLVSGLYTNLEELKNLFIEDQHLNNINMSLININFNMVRYLCNKNKTSWSLADGCCVQKHILIYVVLGAIPIFEDDLINFKELKEEWLNHNYHKYKDINSFCRAKKII